ncbi:shieldin complex subunit 3 [Salminus brasiliensis]|uniref:shieldin complex subunit 3 n=1 Tax=Salminus brasiliensis TaxID=930266 RepID=UPI003B83072C
MDVCLHYKNNQDKRPDLVLITQRTLEDFPTRVLTVFTPWFPSGADRSLPIKPKKAPPVISSKHLKSGRCCLQRSELDFSNNCCPVDEDHCKEARKRKLVTSSEANDGEWHAQVENEPKKFQRSWSVFSQKTKPTESMQSLSRQFHMTIQTFGLHFHQRAKWIICELNCAPHSVEEVWSRLNHAIKHSKLPTCNANLQRNLAQIWVYCDVCYCEYIGHFLRQKLQLSGEINLAVHKLGIIFKL